MENEIQLQASHPQENPNAFQERLTVTQSCKADCHYLKEKINGSPIATRQTFMTPAEILQFLEKMKIERIREASSYAQDFLTDYIRRRNRKIDFRTVLGPTIGDPTYFYRLGTIGNDARGMRIDHIHSDIQALKNAGYPELIRQEVDFINALNYFARAQDTPEKSFIIKHFPGGDVYLETTETQSVHYSDPIAIQRSLDNFKEIIQSSLPPEGIMVSHASYEIQTFPNVESYLAHNDKNLHPWLRGLEISKIPASLNPVIVNYLRNEMDFKGLIIPDWYDMQSINQFLVKNIPSYRGLFKFIPGDSKERVASTILTIFLAVDAGMNFVTAFRANLIDRFDWQSFQKENPQIFTRFEEKLNQNLITTFTLIKPIKVKEEFIPSKFSLREKLQLYLYNKKRNAHQELYQELWKNLDPYKRKIITVFLQNGIGDYDIWNRTGILVLIYRQKLIEHLTGRNFAPPPELKSGSTDSADSKGLKDLQERNSEEAKWFETLMADEVFLNYYNAINWDSPEMHNLYTQKREELLKKYSGIK